MRALQHAVYPNTADSISFPTTPGSFPTTPVLISPEGLYNSYYSGDRAPPVSPPQDRADDSPSHRRSINPQQQGSFLPPPPPQSGLSLPPPSSSSYSSGYHGSSPTTLGMTSTQTSTSTGMAPMTPSGMTYSSHMGGMSQPIGAYHYPLQSSPATMSALPPGRTGQGHGYSPRIPGNYPTASPGMHTLSPLSPSNLMAYPHSSGSTSASSFPPSVPPPHTRIDLPGMGMHEHKKRRTNSGSTSSWDGKDGDDDQPWGMPQEQYKALNPRDKKQVRNRIGARRFRAKRKDYVNQLECSKKESEAKIMQLQAQLESSHREINDLRARLNMPPLPPPAQSVDAGSLGLVVNNNNE